MSVSIYFGSASDKNVFLPLKKQLERKKIKAMVKVLSAHRTPKELEKSVKKSNSKVLIGGAGLSAALPGVLASLSLKPIIGVPVSGNYSGLDALLSVHQIPPGIAVLGVGVDNWKQAAETAALIEKEKFSGITLIKRKGKENEKAMDKARQILEKLDMNYIVQEKPKYDEKKMVYIDFLKLGQKVPDVKNKMVLFVPVKNKNNAKDSLRLLKMSKKGNWTGLNRGDNAALIALQIIGTKKTFKKIKQLRLEKKKEILKERW